MLATARSTSGLARRFRPRAFRCTYGTMNILRSITLASLALCAGACGTPSNNTPDASDMDTGIANADSATVANDAADVTLDSRSSADATVTDTGIATDSGTATDSASGDACAVPPGAAPMLMGPNQCSTLDFGQPAVTPTDVSMAITFRGGAIPPGIYDAVGYSRTAGSLMASYRATLVVGADLRYTEVRQLTTNPMNPGPVTRRSGTLMPTGNMLNRTVTCDGGDAGMDTMTGPYSIENRCDSVLLHFGTTNLWFTYRRRP
jgi:hypothetical protein